MKQNYLRFSITVLAALSWLATSAQTVLNQGNTPLQAGAEFQFVKTAYIAPGPDGSGMNHVVTADSSYDTIFVKIDLAANGPNADSFPNASHRYFFRPDSLVTYVHADQNGIFNDGEHIFTPPGTYPKSDPKMIIPFPMQYQFFGVDSFFSVDVEPTYTDYKYGTYSYGVGGEGSLHLGNTHYAQVVKLESVETAVDSFVDQFGGFVNTIVTRRVGYFTPGIPFPIVESVVRDLGFVADSFSVILVEGLVGIPEPQVNAFHIFPNPAHGVVNVQALHAGNEKATYALLDLQGRMLQCDSMRFDASGKAQLEVDPFPRGLYLLKISTKHEDFVQKLMVD